jgi:hypothetical protein
MTRYAAFFKEEENNTFWGVEGCPDGCTKSTNGPHAASMPQVGQPRPIVMMVHRLLNNYHPRVCYTHFYYYFSALIE